LLVSQRDEAAIHSKNANSVIASEHLRKRDLNFRWCELVHSHYLRHDGHPNAKGYAKVAQCLSQVIKNLVATNGNENIRKRSILW
jgi:lysophospholipase L1-like esterase